MHASWAQQTSRIDPKARPKRIETNIWGTQIILVSLGPDRFACVELLDNCPIAQREQAAQF
jgi:hypothetical protein